MSDTNSTQRLKRLFGAADDLWSRGASGCVPGDLACRAGCFGCCVGLFEVSAGEAVLARAGFERLQPEERAEVAARARRIVDDTALAFPGDVASGLLDPERGEEADDRYFDVVADRACPMLELPSGRCRIYEERPLTCRTYGLAWVRECGVVHPPCTLNLVGESAARLLECGIDLDRLSVAEGRIGDELASRGIDPSRETTLAHMVTGTAFGSDREPPAP